MFRLVVFCEDKKLADVLLALAGKASQIEVPQPVINAAKKNGRLTAETGGSLTDLFAAHIAKVQPTTLRNSNVVQWLQSIGRPQGTSGHVIKMAIQRGILKKLPRKGKGAGFALTYAPVAPKQESKS